MKKNLYRRKHKWNWLIAVLCLALLVSLPGVGALAAGAEQTTAEPDALSQPPDEAETGAAEAGEAPSPQPDEDGQAAGEEPPSPAPGAQEASQPQAEEGSTSIVTTYSQLKDALANDNGYTTIYLGADIKADNTGIIIHKSKAQVVIDGCPPGAPEGTRYTFTQALSTNANYVIRLEAGNSTTKTVTVRNIKVAGGNYYGVVGVPEALKGVTISYENMDYTGPQALFNRGGTGRFINSTFLLKTNGSAVNELAEVASAEFGGEVQVTSTSTADSVLWLAGSSTAFTVLPQADVSISTGHYFIYADASQPVADIGRDASLTVVQSNGFTNGAQRFSTYTQQPGSSVSITQKAASDYGTLRVAKSLLVHEDASLIIRRAGTKGAAIHFPDSGSSAVFSNPKLVKLQGLLGRPFYFAATTDLTIEAQSLNQWKTIADPDDESLAASPTHFWNKAGDGLLHLTARYTGTTVNQFSHNLTSEDPTDTELNKNTLPLTDMQLVTFGALPLQIDTVRQSSAVVGGHTLPNARLQIYYTGTENETETLTGAADAQGNYLADFGQQRPLVNSRLAVRASANMLNVRQHTTVLADDGALSFLQVPQTLPFGSWQLPGATTIIGRQNGALDISVLDSRVNPTPWRLDASLEMPLAATENGQTYTLPQALVFVDESNQSHVLGPAPYTVFRQGENQAGQFDLHWDDNRGILLKLAPGEAKSGAHYQATIHWTLVSAP